MSEGDPHPRTYEVGEGTLVRLVAGRNGYFAVKHHAFTEPPVRVISAHHVSAPDLAVARLQIDDNWEVSGVGDAEAWSHLPELFDLVYPYVLHFSPAAARIMKLPGIPNEPEIPDDPHRTVPCPDSRHAVVAQTRRGRFVVYDLLDGTIACDITIGEGRPIFRFHPETGNAWLARHDTIVRFDAAWQIERMDRIRGTVRGAIISDMVFRGDGRRVAIAFSERRPVPMIQPYRLAPVEGGVMLIDPASMEVTSGAATERWVDEVAFLDNDRLAMRERGGEIEIRFTETAPVDWKLYPPRGPDEQWL